MNKKIWIALAVVVALVFWGVGSRNGMATSDQEVKASWANVQSAYQRRADLIPNLVNTVKGEANFEKSTLEMKSILTFVPNLSACSFNSFIIVGPSTPLG